MKRILLLLGAALYMIPAPALAASRYFITTGCDGNWGTSACWSATSGGATSGVAPTASDDVHFDGNSTNCVVNSSSRVALSVTFVGYTGTFSGTQQLTVSGSYTLSAGMTYTYSGLLIINGSATLTSAGKTHAGAMTLTSSATYTLADDWDVDGTLTIGATTSAVVLNGAFTISAGGSLTLGNTTGNTTGTGAVTMNGTGTFTSSMTTGQFRPNLTFNTAGTITFAAGTLVYATGTLTYTAGTIVTPNNMNLLLNGSANVTLAVSGITWGTVSMTGAQTVTLSQNMSASGLCSFGAAASAVIVNGNTLNCAAGLRYLGTSGNISGTTRFKLTSTGTVDAPSVTTGKTLNPIEFAAGGGTITLSSVNLIDLGQLLFTSGTIRSTALGDWASGGSGGQKGYSWIQ